MSNHTNIESNKEIGARLQKARMSKRMAQKTLAGIIGITEHHISAIERGQNKASIEVLLGYCKALDMTPNDVLGIV